MRATTIYSAINLCRTRKRIVSRLSSVEPFCDTDAGDYYSQLYQRYDRLEQKLEKRLLLILERYDSVNSLNAALRNEWRKYPPRRLGENSYIKQLDTQERQLK